MIALEQLEEMFGNIKANTDWNVDGPLLWGYFFTDESEEKLKKVIPILEAQGYRFVDLSVPDLDKGQDEYFLLHVEKEETHSPSSLHERNQQLYSFVNLHNLGGYDGMDVGPIPRSAEH